MNKLKHKKSSFNKEEKMIRQMLKTNEVRIRSIEKENKNLRRKMETFKEKNQTLEKGIEILINEIIIRGAKKQEIKVLISNVSQYVDLDEIFIDNNSIDTEEELGISFNDSLLKLKDNQENFNKKNKKNLNNLNLTDSLDSLSTVNNPTVVNSKPYKRTLSPIEKERENSQFKLRLEEEIEENIKRH